MTDGLKDAHREAIIAVLAANDHVDRAVLFGSRATGTNTVSSDVDIALFGDRLTLTDQARLAAALEEIPMAQSVDLVLYDSIRNRTLQDHIRRQGVEWPLRTRREVAATFREVSEFTIGGGWGRDTEFDDSVPVRVIRGTDFDRLRNGEFSGVPARYEQRSKVQRRMLKPGDILLEISGGSRTSNQSTGRSCFITDRALAQLGKRVIPASFCRLVRVDQAVVDPRLAYYALQEMYVSGRAALYEQQSTGISNFQFEYFLDSEVFRLPPLFEQRAIAHVLGTLDDKIELNRRMNATLESMARALFRSWFVDFDPVRAKMEGRDTGLPKETAGLFPDRLVDSELGEIPEGWQLEALDSVADFQNGLALQKFRPSQNEARLPVVKIAQLRAGEANSDEWASAGIKPECIIENGNVVFSWSGSLLVRTWCGGRAALNQHLFKVTSERYPKWFYLHSILSHFPEFQRIAADKATTMGHIRRHHLTDALCVVPSDCLITRVSGLLGGLLERRVANEVASRTLVSLRDALLPKLVSGELRVTGLEAPSMHDDCPAPVATPGA